MKIKRRNVTLESLATMVAEGFAETAKKTETATKQDIADMATKQDISRLDKKINNLDKRLKDIAARLEHVEMKLDRALYKEIERLDEMIRQLARKVNVKLEY